MQFLNELAVMLALTWLDVLALALFGGLRAYYFGVAALSWFLHPALMMAVTLGVVYVLHQREFRSRTLAVLTEGEASS